MRNQFIVLSTITVLAILAAAFFLTPWALLAFIIVGPLVFFGSMDLIQKKQTIRRNFPLLGAGRYWMEKLRPKIYQYFVESEIDGTPINRMFRSIIYQRAKSDLDTLPFGTKMEVYRAGYEWVNHSMSPLNSKSLNQDPRITVGGPDCIKPYDASILNISAMSYGALSKNAVLSLNLGAKMGGFAHNTGEGSISPYHEEPKGDLIWQIGTGYFGCRTLEGGFDEELFQKRSNSDQVKMIEIKISQGAKPAHGGILPAAKNNEEIASIRNVKPHTEVVSPPYHTAFSGPEGLISFIKKLRDLSGGKPIGFKLCLGQKSEFITLCKEMIKTGVKPDFITVDGGEGGTGAAPLEFSNSVGMPLREGLAFVYDALVGYNLKEDIKIFASGKIFTAFHIFRALSLGADACYTARGVMIALGCIQALECNNNNCPTGITTHKPHLVQGLVVSDKSKRVANFHKDTVEALVELLAATGLDKLSKINRTHINRRLNMTQIKRYDEIYPEVQPGEFLKDNYPAGMELHVKEADAYFG
ncbi:MAG: FMN-binding glutamate synthase family protein [Bacteroidota bacterium]